MFIILIFVIALVAWSLHLMQEAFDHQEFSLMLAGTLVAIAAAAMMAVYFLMGDYMVYLHQMDQHSATLNQYPDPLTPVLVSTRVDTWSSNYYNAVDSSIIYSAPVTP